MLSNYIVAGVVGVMLFFSVAVAPTIFKVLPQEWASAYVRKFFPKYYAVLGVACLVAGLLATNMTTKIIILNCAALFVISLLILTPNINNARDNNHTKQFNLLHGLSVLVNMLQLIMLIYCLWLVK